VDGGAIAISMSKQLEGAHLSIEGAQLFCGAAQSILPKLELLISKLPRDKAGIRLHNNAELNSILANSGSIQEIVSTSLNLPARPVRAVLFDKSAKSNWALGWHQDRTIVVKRSVESAGYGPWTMKAGLQHVEPPFAILRDMVTIRIHIDNVDDQNAPLLVSPGTHKLGRITEDKIQAAVNMYGSARCCAKAGDVWIYSTPILHASASSLTDRRRRVLQVDYSASALPNGLEWQGI
jgi:Phytanoyl-CoA dioxygenase (PhyH)